MHIAVIGSGYVGLVVGACLSESGNDVVCADIDPDKIDRLNRGQIPIYEPGLEPLIARNLAAGRLRFTTDVPEAARASDVIFIAVGTPPDEDGSADLKHVLDVARTIGRSLNGRKIVITKSTVPVGTARRVREAMEEAAAAEGGERYPVHVCSNPEFLKEGAAVEDFMKPDRVVLGVDSEYAAGVLRELYEPFVRSSHAILLMDVPAAEITKYAANAMLATRISFMNAIAGLCERAGADVDAVRRGVGSDPRIGPSFLFPGAGFGGSCLVGSETARVRWNGDRARLRSLGDVFRDCAVAPESVPGDVEPEVAWPSDLLVLSWSRSRGAHWRPASAVTRRWYEGDLVEVRTERGRRVRCTPDHPFVVSDSRGGAAGVRLAGELTPSDWLPLQFEPPDPTAVMAHSRGPGRARGIHGGGTPGLLEMEETVASRTGGSSYRPGGDTAWVRVVDTPRSAFRGWVFSLEVPGTETFVTTGGLVVHNCFPKDVKALIRTMSEMGADPSILEAVEGVNERQKRLLLERVVERFGQDLTGRTVAVWGLAFKPNTDDMREAPSIVTIEGLLERGARVVAHDPVAADEARRRFGERIALAETNYDALAGADCLVIHTEWHPYRRPDFARMKELMKSPVVFDGRNLYDPARMEAEGFEYWSVGRRKTGGA